MAGQAVKIWAYPNLSAEEITALTTASDKGIEKLDNHAYITQGKIADLYQVLRQNILALDESVSEEFKKLYIAYKMESNFVDIIPQANALKLILNMRFDEIHDPKNLCEDVTNKGLWGNGDVRVTINEINELDDVMNLIRQSFEKQRSETLS
ncbi:DUF5655 domain-containing protein [Necropsobacter massiliensis]|uniref:DUF5655 domain-containing protein n=1 Tax=Necropsobacter massiliensis TaxID=1400001 RepID=UPI000AB598B2|nr:DUF5655 domain-containing protein [Necropsobacter massiliensis]